MTVSCGVLLEQQNALQDALDIINERGNDISIRFADETSVSRDIYKSIKKISPTIYSWKAYPIIYNPTVQDLEKAGIKENCDVLATLAMKDFIDNGLVYESINKIRWEVNLDGNIFTVKDKNQVNQFANIYLNIVLGLFKK